MKKLNLIVFIIIIFITHSLGQGNNTKYGTSAGASLTSSAYYNTLIGYKAGKDITDADYNTLVGANAGYFNTSGSYNSFFGNSAGYFNTSGWFNSFFGHRAGFDNETGDYNTFIGNVAGSNNTTGYQNTFLGSGSGLSNTEGYRNTFLGNNAGSSNTTGNANTLLGNHSGASNITGNANTFSGFFAGYSNTSGDHNVFLGYQAGYYENSSNKLYIANNSTNHLIYGDFATNQIGINTKTLDSYTLATGGDIGIEGDITITKNGHKRDKIKLWKGLTGHTIGTESYHTTFGPQSSYGSSIGHKFYATDTELAATIGFGGQGTPSNRLNSTFYGNVGIGTENPQNELDVNGTASATKLLTGKMEADTLDVNGDLTVQGKIHLSKEIETDGGTLKIKTADGYLKLGPDNSQFCRFLTNKSRYFLNKEIRVNSGFIGSFDEDLNLRTAGTNRLSILRSNGNVGIGTENPQNKLDVNGTASAIKFLAEEVEVKLMADWPDYVFHNDYELPSLEEEAQYIEENGHLSSFESAEEMADKIPLGDVTQRQQETIEKMMLHLIQMDERMKKLEKENIALKELLEKNQDKK